MQVPDYGSPYDDALATAVEAARRASSLIRGDAGDLENVRDKGTNDFVTATDEAAQAAILDVLTGAEPGVEILAEEGTDPSGIEPAGDRWIVDPLDGTTNFMHGLPPYAVSIALQAGDALAVAVVLEVTSDTLYTAVAGHGLRVNGRPAQVTRTAGFEDAFVATGFPYRRFDHTDLYVDVLTRFIREARGVRRQGAASVDLAHLAAGRFDGFFETGLSPWDVAAGILLIREGGGRVTTYDGSGGLAPVYQRQVCGSNGPLHDAILHRVHPMVDVRL